MSALLLRTVCAAVLIIASVRAEAKHDLTDSEFRSEMGVPQEHEKHTIREVAAVSFKQLDANGDGKLDVQEFEHYPETPVYQEMIKSGVIKNIHYHTAFAHADDDFDLALSPSEFVEWAHNTLVSAENIAFTWKFADKDENGELSFAEYHEAMGEDDENESMRHFLMLARDKKVATRDDFERFHSPDDFGAADLNDDEVLDEQEFTTATFHYNAMHEHDPFKMKDLKKSFHEYDLDKDGRVSAFEFNTHHHKVAKLPDMVLTEVDGMKIEDFDLPADVEAAHADEAEQDLNYEMLDDL